VYDLDKTPLEGSSDAFMHEESPSLCFNNIFLSNSLDHSHISPCCLLPSPSPEYYIDVPISNLMICDANMDLGHEDNMFRMLGGKVDDYVSLDYFKGYDPLIDPYCVCLEDLFRKVIWTTFFNPSYDFFMGSNKVKRIFVVFGVILIIASYLVFSKLWS